ncbi:4,5:9,10-diseco-3-hydroxy-5,9, 17-trioxoandrosta-1(10),2-diene-4-oate hydrolase [Thermoflexales bacterium]|nr:4,5:9,10-diseco-3-hydroxy-5,9, 17-trioxoandrosta-1(10),2-diene-4-oate hydrolase [Thermoflexales bacterium]
MNFLLGLISALIGGSALLYGNHRLRVARWRRQAACYGQTVILEGRQVFYRLKGHGPLTIVVEPALGAPSAEWWQLQDQLAACATVLTFDRPGYGWSDPAPTPRTSEQAARELQQLLDAIDRRGSVILIGHSLGGLYVNHFARLYPDRVRAAILLDPVSPRDAVAQQELPPEVYLSSGWDKTSGMKLAGTVNRLGLLRYLKPLMLKSPPFYYYKNLPPEQIEVIWQHLLNPTLAPTALEEYRQMHLPQNNLPLLTATGFPPIPLKVIYHTPQIIVDEIVKYGGLSNDQAWQVENLWEKLLREYLTLSPDSEWITTTQASHFIHMDEPELVLNVVKKLLAEIQA